MSKRFTDTDKWKKPFVRGLEGAYKLLWFYILDDCDHAGIWHVDIEVACIRIGDNITLSEAQEKFTNHIVIFDNGNKWFIADFIEFQYGELNENNRVHNSVLKQLNKYGLNENKGLTSTLKGVKDKDKDKLKDQDKEIQEFIDFWNIYDKKRGIDKTSDYFIGKVPLKNKKKITDSDRKLIMAHVPRYIQSTPDKQVRKDPSTYLYNSAWLDEIIESQPDENSGIPQRPNPKFLEGKSHEFTKKVWAIWRDNGWEYSEKHKEWIENGINHPKVSEIGK